MSLRARLILLVLLALIPVAVLLIYTNLEERRRAVADAREDALTRVQFLKVDLEQKVENARQLLITLTQVQDVRSEDPATCAARLTELTKLHPGYSGIGVAEANGDILCSTVAPPRPLNAIQEKYAWFQRVLETRDFSVGDYQVESRTGQAILTFGYPLLDRQNQVQGIVFAAIRLATFNQLASETQYPEQAALITIDRNGTILDSDPQPEVWVGKTLPEAPLVQSMLIQRQGVAEMAGVDGVPRLYAFAPVRNAVETGIYVGVGIPTDVVFADANGTLLRNLLALGLIAALALAAALFSANAFILRHVKGLVSATQHLRRGDLSARSESVSATAELDELALAFNEMAAALEQREAQRKQAENTLREQREVLQVTLSSIGDAVMATDAQGDVTFMNPIAEAFTGWTQAEAAGKSLDTIFHIIDEDTRQAAENPATRVLREGAITGLAHHTLLVTRRGAELAIDDSAAPIRNAAGDVVGVVLVFRDISERRSAERRLLIQYLVTRILAESDSLEKVATKVLQAICEWIGWQAGTLWRVDRGANVLRHERTWQAPALPVTDLETVNRESTFPPERDLPGRAWAKGQPVWLPDIGEDAQFARAGAAVNMGLHTALAVPLRSRSEVVGVLECLSDKRQEPDEDLLIMLEALGAQIGNFIERKQAEEALKQAEQAQRLLAEAGYLLTASLDDETRLANVAKRLVTDLSDWCAIDLIEDDRAVRRLAVAHVDPTKVALVEDIYRRYPPDWNAPVGVPQVLRSGQSEFFPEVTEELLRALAHEVEQLKLLRELGLESAVIVPMIAHGRTFGAITLVRSESGRRYTLADVALAEELARRCALALEDARLYEAESAARAEAEAAQQRLSFLAEAHRALMTSTELNARLEGLTRYIVPTLADWCTVDLIEPDESIRLAAAAHRDPDKTPKIHDLARRYPLDPAGPSGTPRVLRTGLPETSSRVASARPDEPGENDDYERSLEELGFKSYMIVPLKARGRTIGAMTLVSANAGRPYTRADLTLAEELAARAALAVDNALLYQEAQQLNADLEQRVKERTALLQANNEKLQEQIAERQRAEAELTEVRHQLAKGREGERLHLAQELHDGPVQDLYGISYRLAGLKDVLRDDTTVEQFSAAQVELQQVIHTLRSISSELRPPTLTPFGLETAIRSHAERLQAEHPELDLHLDLIRDRQQLPEAVRIALFRIYQQSLSNVVRHSQARQVTVRFTLDAEEAVLEIRDDGCGFKVPEHWIDLVRQGHLGLIGAAERAEALGGNFKVTSTPGKGTLIWVGIPHTIDLPR